MCGRITLRTNLRQIADEFQASLPGFDVTPRYNVSPGQLVLAVRGAETRELVQALGFDSVVGPRTISWRFSV